jgi:hypothetical protein
MINLALFNFCFCACGIDAQLQIASDVVNIFIPQDASPCQEKILYLQHKDPILHARKAFKHEALRQSTVPRQNPANLHRTAFERGANALYRSVRRVNEW